MTQAGFPVPYGFIVTSHAYFSFIKDARLENIIRNTIAGINFDNPHEIQQTSLHVQEMIKRATLPKDIILEIVNYYDELLTKEQKYQKNAFISSCMRG